MTHEEWLDIWYPPRCNMLKDISVSAAILNNRLWDWRDLIYVQLQTKKTETTLIRRLLPNRSMVYVGEPQVASNQARLTPAPNEH